MERNVMADNFASVVSRLETKLDQNNEKIDSVQSQVTEITRTLQTLARVEERMSFQKEGMARMGKQLDNLEERVSKIEQSNAGEKEKVSGIERFVWVAITAIAGIIGYKFK